MENPAIYLIWVLRNLKMIMSYAKHKHKTTGATLTPICIIKDFNECKISAILWLKKLVEELVKPFEISDRKERRKEGET